MTWIPALRWDHYNDMESQACPKLGWMLQGGRGHRWSITANIGRSFRAPSFNDLYWPDDGFAYGNPDLKPETATNMDFGLRIEAFRTGYLSGLHLSARDTPRQDP